jgi:N-acyl-D-aspartate/D-glutamate deacylase
MMLLPHLVNELLEGLSPTVGHIALRVADMFGYSTESHKTVEAKIWAPTKPIAHAAAAAMLCFSVLNDPEQGWDEQHQLCYQNPFLATLFYEDVFRSMLLRVAELLRLQVPSCDRFHIRECETIRFIAD